MFDIYINPCPYVRWNWDFIKNEEGEVNNLNITRKSIFSETVYDKYGRLINCSINATCEFNEYGNISHIISGLIDVDLEYDELRRLVKITTFGYEEVREYDDNNHLIHLKTSDGFELNWDYDSKGRFIHFRNTFDNYEEFVSYSEDGGRIVKNNYNIEYHFDAKGRLTYRDTEDEFENREYDDSTQLMHLVLKIKGEVIDNSYYTFDGKFVRYCGIMKD